MLDLTAPGPARASGVAKLVSRPAGPDSGELDLDHSIDAVLRARSEGRQPRLDDLRAHHWAKPDSALCLVVDRSGSMDGSRLAAAALATAACTWRVPDNLAVLAFSDRVLTLKTVTDRSRPDELVNSVLALRGHGTTDIALALEAARQQLESSGARRRLTIVLSDGESTTGDDPLPAARRLDELAIIAPADEPRHATALARDSGARLRLIATPMDIVQALNAVLR
jgi:Mg-chelatase subunit ChlD